ncbi:MAG TPA: cytochrome c-type biogenesis CcmF C-terminal domain-containing protein, partial [Steroidobacteraceae bacterium]|nr:cytochrome c-type biogenesis CcmF C-terminal domain-containing protein [Steroidobacteraceae bacterium]
SVGAPYYNRTFLVPMLPLFALVGLGAFARWKRGQLGESRRRLLACLGIAVVLGLALMLGLYGDRSLLGPIGVVLALWIICTALVDPLDRLRRRLSLPLAVLGMTLAHVGLAVTLLGITTMESRRVERDVSLAPGQQAQLGDYAFRLDSIKQDIDGPNYTATRARVVVTRNGKPDVVLLPEQREYDVQQQSLAQAALGVSWRRDVMVTLGEPVGNGAWSMRLQVRPLMRLVWLGAMCMAGGGLLATLDRRYRRRREALAQQQAAAAGAAPGVAS